MIYSDTVQGVYFTGMLDNNTAITFPGSAPGNGMNAPFRGGDTPGVMTMHIEAVFTDGQVSRCDFRLSIGDFNPPPVP